MAILESKYSIGDLVYLKTDVEQLQWMVCEIHFRPNDIAYHLSCGGNCYLAYEFEISSEENMVKKLQISK